jgi:ribonucleoside-diphosphate reductase alpha chain
MLMRVSVGIHLDDLESVLETYDLMLKILYTCNTNII